MGLFSDKVLLNSRIQERYELQKQRMVLRNHLHGLRNTTSFIGNFSMNPLLKPSELACSGSFETILKDSINKDIEHYMGSIEKDFAPGGGMYNQIYEQARKQVFFNRGIKTTEAPDDMKEDVDIEVLSLLTTELAKAKQIRMQEVGGNLLHAKQQELANMQHTIDTQMEDIDYRLKIVEKEIQDAQGKIKDSIDETYKNAYA